jgi:hypothetical protein
MDLGLGGVVKTFKFWKASKVKKIKTFGAMKTPKD